MGSPRLDPNTVRNALASRELVRSLGWSPYGDDPDALGAHPPNSARQSALPHPHFVGVKVDRPLAIASSRVGRSLAGHRGLQQHDHTQTERSGNASAPR